VARAACCLSGALRPSEQAGGFPEPRPLRFPPGGVLVWNANAGNCNHPDRRFRRGCPKWNPGIRFPHRLMAALMRGQGAKISSIAFPHVGWCVVPTRKPLFPKEETMAEASGAMTGKPLIESDTVEGTTVYDPAGNNIGSIKRLMSKRSAVVLPML
jgi:hypothetical protein